MALGLIFALCMTQSGCGGSDSMHISGCTIEHEPEFGGVYIHKTIDEFNELGYQYGDSVDITFSNGYTLEDLPYYNGYYTEIGEPVLVAYPGYDYIKLAVNSGGDAWEIGELSDDDTAEIILNTAQKYLSVQMARDIHYLDERDAYKSDEVFANFRNVQVGNLKPGILYRSASPCDNQHNRAAYTDALIEEAGIAFILNLADDHDKIEGYRTAGDFNSPYFNSLYDAGKVNPIALDMNYTSDHFRDKLVDGLITMSDNDGPYLVHCTEGKDRTGFVCVFLEALAGASYSEMVRDYMVTYDNYYQISRKTDPERYDVIVESVFNPMLEYIAGDENVNLKKVDYAARAEQILMDGGMTNDAIKQLKSRLLTE